jgi:tRNA pseudouridine55 synthase
MKEGTKMDGILPIYKPVGMTSHDVVFKLRKILHTKKIGHAGTLDPNVDGVLPIAIGKATKTIEFLQTAGKTYSGEVTFGFATTTEDLDGEVVERTPLSVPFSDQQIDDGMAKLTGDIIQIPPMYSAVKVNGRRLYEYARAGEHVDRPKRHATIHAFNRTSEPIFDVDKGIQKFTFEAVVSKGTYIRTLSADLGDKLGVVAVMSQLTRRAAGGYQLADTYTLEQVADEMTKSGNVDGWLQPIDSALQDLPHHELSTDEFAKVKNGVGLPRSISPEPVPKLVLMYHGQVKSIFEWRPDKGLYRPFRTIDLSE